MNRTGIQKRPVRKLALCLWLGLCGVCAGFSAAADDSARMGTAVGRVDTPAQVKLGAQLFVDPKLSVNGKISCASCHQADKAFTDGRAVALGIDGRAGLRNSPSLLNVGHHRAFFWDGRAPTLERQVLEPLTNPDEHGFARLEDLLRKLRADPGYRVTFKQAFSKAGENAIQANTLASALAAHVRSLISPESAIDRFLLKGDKSALGAEAQAGLALFRGRAQCAGCHALNDDAGRGRVQLSDQQFHAHGNQVYPMQTAVRSRLAAGQTRADMAKANPAEASALGRFMVTGAVEDAGGFKTPSLRNVARTAPYFHDGSAATLEAAMNRELLGKTSEISLSAAESRQLLAFLLALNDDAAPVRQPAAKR